MLDLRQQPSYVAAMKLGARLRHARDKRGMTQEQLAAAASTPESPVSQAAISALEKRDSETTTALFQFARALGVNPEWLQTGKGDSGLDTKGGWRPAGDLLPNEAELLRNYRAAGKRWQLSLLLMSKLRGDEAQDEVAEGMNVLLAKIAADPVSDERLGDAWTRPDRKK